MTIAIGSSFVNANGSISINSAGGSGLDEQSLIQAEEQGAQNELTPIQDQVTLNNSKVSALQQLNTLMSSLQTAAAQLSNPAGFNQAANNAFDYVKASVTASDGSTGSNYMTVTAQPGATPQTYTLGNDTSPAIIQLAQAKQQVTNTFSVASADTAIVVSSPSAGQIGAGTVVLNTPGGGTASITLNAGDSLNAVAANFNSISGTTGISASVIQIASGTYDLQFTATSTGSAADFSLNAGDPDSVINSDPSGVLSNLTFTQTQKAQNAQFTLNGQVIDRATNSISDVVQGLTFNLLQPTPTSPSNTTLQVAVTPDTTTAENSIVSFINAYNNIMQFYAQQTQLNSDGTYATTAYLAQDSTLTTAMSALQSKLSGIVSGLPSNAYNALSQVGVSFTNLPAVTDSSGNVTTPAITNALTYNQSTLEAALASNFSQVQAVFGFTFNSSDSNVAINTRTNALQVSNFTLNLQPSTSTFTATYTDSTGSHTVNLTATPFSSGSGYTLTTPADSALAGLSMLYGSTADSTNISVTATQGIADYVSNLATSLTTANTGGIAADVSGLQTNTTSLNNNIALINKQIAAQTTQLQNELAIMEQAIASANTILDTLTAEQNAALSSSGHG